MLVADRERSGRLFYWSAEQTPRLALQSDAWAPRFSRARTGVRQKQKFTARRCARTFEPILRPHRSAFRYGSTCSALLRVAANTSAYAPGSAHLLVARQATGDTEAQAKVPVPRMVPEPERRPAVLSRAVPAPATMEYGTVELHFSDCLNGTMTYHIPAGPVSGVIPLTRIAKDHLSLCASLGSPDPGVITE